MTIRLSVRLLGVLLQGAIINERSAPQSVVHPILLFLHPFICPRLCKLVPLVWLSHERIDTLLGGKKNTLKKKNNLGEGGFY